MDCPSEEQMIRMKLEGLENIKHLNFDIPNRKLEVIHSAESSDILDCLAGLKLGTTFTSEEKVEDYEVVTNSETNERKMLWAVLIINFAFFIIEMLYGWLSNSMGLIADSLDMLADSLVYGLSLMAVGSTLIKKKMVAKWSGYFQILLATHKKNTIISAIFSGNSSI